MSDFRPMNECKGFNMERLLIETKHGYMFTGYYKDGMIRADGNEEEWNRPIEFKAFMLLKDLANEAHKQPDTKALALNSIKPCLSSDEKEEKAKIITEILYIHTDENEMKIREVDYEEVVKDIMKID